MVLYGFLEKFASFEGILGSQVKFVIVFRVLMTGSNLGALTRDSNLNCSPELLRNLELCKVVGVGYL